MGASNMLLRVTLRGTSISSISCVLCEGVHFGSNSFIKPIFCLFECAFFFGFVLFVGFFVFVFVFHEYMPSFLFSLAN